MIKKYKYITISKEERLALKTVMGQYQIKFAEEMRSNASLENQMIDILSKLLIRSKHKNETD